MIKIIPEWLFQEIVKAILVGIPTGFFSFFLAMWYFNKYQLPKLAPSMGKEAVKHVAELPEIKKLIEKGNGLIEQLEPIIENVKKVDFEKIQSDLAPLLNTLKKINVETIEELIEVIKSLAEKATKKPKVPTPQ